MYILEMVLFCRLHHFEFRLFAVQNERAHLTIYYERGDESECNRLGRSLNSVPGFHYTICTKSTNTITVLCGINK